MTKEEKLIKSKLGLLELADYLKNVSEACRVMGYSRDTFYRVKEAYETGGMEALKEKSRRKPNRKNRVSEELEKRIVELAYEEPAWGQVRIANTLRQEGQFISACGVRCVWLRHGLETMKKRLAALEARVAESGEVLTESQIAALERAKEQKAACGEIETAHPGYLGSQDTYYVGFIKGVGKIYQQTFVDTYSQVVCAKVYDQKRPIQAADALNDRVLPMFEKHEIPLLRILTDRGTEYCGREDSHDYQLFLALMDIEHTKTKVRSPQTNGICERVNRTMQDEFYKVAFRKKIYRSLEDLQIDLDAWLVKYNTQRTNQGKHCKGRTPMQTFLEDRCLVNEKDLSKLTAEENLPLAA
jgi:transposase InsO family protein